MVDCDCLLLLNAGGLGLPRRVLGNLASRDLYMFLRSFCQHVFLRSLNSHMFLPTYVMRSFCQHKFAYDSAQLLPDAIVAKGHLCACPPAGAPAFPEANSRTKILDFRGFDSSIILILRGGIIMSIIVTIIIIVVLTLRVTIVIMTVIITIIIIVIARGLPRGGPAARPEAGARGPRHLEPGGRRRDVFNS